MTPVRETRLLTVTIDINSHDFFGVAAAGGRWWI
jgi:hypothetical protein